MKDVQIAITELHDLATTLTNLSGDLMGLDAEAEYARSELGHDRVIGAMEEFHSNWKNNREYVCSKLDDLSELADNTANGFTEADSDLAAQINETVAAQ